MKILIVEDSPPMRRMIRRTIAAWADEICECGDGGEALALYSEHRPDWVLMDIELKEINGLTATCRIIDQFPQARVVMVTNYNDSEIREAARRAGACGYLLKEHLFNLRQYLEAAETEREL